MQKFEPFFPIYFIGMWILVTYLISRRGWSKLVANYETSTPFTGNRVGIISASINNTRYKNSLTLKYNEEGLYLRPVIIFRLFHNPILIPWKEIKEVHHKKFLFTSYEELVIGTPLVATISIDRSIFNKIEDSLNTYSIPPSSQKRI